MPPKAAEVIVLCEDRAHDVFVRRFLKTWHVGKKKRIRVIDYPEGRGSGKNHVLQELPEQIRALRSRPASIVLLVVLDADEKTVQQWHSEFDALTCRDSFQRSVAYIVPKWSIDTWVAYLDSTADVQEQEQFKYKRNYRKAAASKEIHPLVDSLADICRKGQELWQAPPSLRTACEEFQTIRNAL